MENKRKKRLNDKSEKFDMNNSDFAPNRTDNARFRGDMRNGERLDATVGMRKVNKDTTAFQKDKSHASERLYLRSDFTDADRHKEMEKKRKQERLRRERMRALIGIIAAAAVAVILLFMTPIFNIREIRLNGNNTVPKEVITEKIGDEVGSNLFAASVSKIEKKMDEIPQIKSVEVTKRIFPSCLEVNIVERVPAAYLLSGSSTIIVDSDLQVIDDSSVFSNENLPSISGVSVSKYELNKPLDLDSEEKREILITMLKCFESTGLTGEITYISVDDLSNLAFNYDNRIDVLCGSQLQLERKIRMFTEALKTDSITEDSMGVMDLSVPGQGEFA